MVRLWFFSLLLATTNSALTLARKTALPSCFVSQTPSRRRRFVFGELASKKSGDSTEEEVWEDDAADFPGGVSSSFQGAGCARSELQPEEIPPLLMEALVNNDVPEIDSGIKAMWEFAGGNTHYIFEQNRTDFIESAHETADEFPTSFYGAAMYGKSWVMETPLNRVGGPDGWIATQVMKTICSDGRTRRWQWELRQNRRPPNRGVWLVESIGSSDRKGNFEPDG